MRVLLQRVSSASVSVEGKRTGEIGVGLLALIAVAQLDGRQQADWIAGRLAHVRLFDDEEGKIERSLTEMGASVLCVSQFTLYGQLTKGTRPNFGKAANAEHARDIYAYFVNQLRAQGIRVETGRFGAKMEISLVNDGPVTLLLEK